MASVWLGLPSRLIELTEPTSSTLAVPRTKRAASLHSGLLSEQKKCIAFFERPDFPAVLVSSAIL